MKKPQSKNPIGKVFRGDLKLEARYANYFKVGHNAFEFILDFGQYYPETDEVALYTRIATSPCYAKSLLKTLQDSIAQYEKNFGSIKEE